MPDPRTIVWNLIRQWHTLAAPPLVPDRTAAGPGASPESWHGLPPRDRAFAFDLVTGIIRWRGLLDAVIASRLRQPLETLDLPLRALLWLGAYQLLLQRGTAAYAAVDTTVSLARREASTAKAAGLVNAVLRGITRLSPTFEATPPGVGGRARLSRRRFASDFFNPVEFSADIFPDPQSSLSAHLAAVTSHPLPLVDHLRALYGDDVACDLLLRNNQRPLVTFRCDQAALDIPAAAGLVARPSAPRFLIAAEGWNDFIERAVRKGTLSPQDPTAALPVRRVAEWAAAGEHAVTPPATILDLCAGLGTKTMQLARAFPQAAVTAADIDAAKLERLAARAAQIGITNIRTTAAAGLRQATAQRFDLVLVDVPCSNTGVMAKRVQSRWRWPSLDHAALHELQGKLVVQGLSLVRPGGLLIYSTCSIDPAENTAILQHVPAAHVRLVEELTLPSLAPPDPASSGPVHDGGYFAMLKASASF